MKEISENIIIFESQYLKSTNYSTNISFLPYYYSIRNHKEIMNWKKTVQTSLILFITAGATDAVAQNSMGVGTQNPNPNAVLELVSPNNNQGFLVPRLTTAQRTDVGFTGNLSDDDNGLMVFDTDEGLFYFWMSGSWIAVPNQTNAVDSSTYADTAFYAFDANTISGFTVEASVPAGALFTDNQSASQVAFTPAGNITSTDVQTALEELDTDLSGLGAGDMLASTYDVDGDNFTDTSEYALDAGTIAGFTVDTSVPAGAVFTDNQSALDVAVTPTVDLVSGDVQSALEELQSEIVAAGNGDMFRSTYDPDQDGSVNSADSAGLASVAMAADSLSADFIDGVTLAYNITGQYIEVPDDGITDAKISGVSPGKLLPGGATDGDILFYDEFGSGWTPTSTISSAVIDASETTDGQLLVASGGNWLPGFPDATSITYDNATSGLSGFLVQDAIDELASQVSIPPAVSLQDAYDNGNSITTSGGLSFSANNLSNTTDSYAISGIVPNGQNAGSAAYFQTADGGINDPTVVIENAGNQRGLFITTTNASTGLPALQVDYGGQGAAMILNSTNTDSGVLVEFQENNFGVASVSDDGSFNGTSLGLSNGSQVRVIPNTQTGNANLNIPDLGGTDNTMALVSDIPWATSGFDISYSTGNVGIGTNSPTQTLDVVGSGRFSSNVQMGGLQVGGESQFNNNVSFFGGILNSVKPVDAGGEYTIGLQDNVIFINSAVSTITIPESLPIGSTFIITVSETAGTNIPVATSGTENFVQNATVVMRGGVNNFTSITILKVTDTLWSVVSGVANFGADG